MWLRGLASTMTMLVAAGAVKIMASGGELTPGTNSHEARYGLDELRAAVQEAHRHGLPITAHAHAVTAIANAVAVGVDSIEHATFLTADGVGTRPELIEAIVSAGVIVSATLGRIPGAAPPPRLAALLPGLIAHFSGCGRRESRWSAAATPELVRRARTTSCRTLRP